MELSALSQSELRQLPTWMLGHSAASASPVKGGNSSDTSAPLPWDLTQCHGYARACVCVRVPPSCMYIFFLPSSFNDLQNSFRPPMCILFCYILRTHIIYCTMPAKVLQVRKKCVNVTTMMNVKVKQRCLKICKEALFFPSGGGGRLMCLYGIPGWTNRC